VEGADNGLILLNGVAILHFGRAHAIRSKRTIAPGNDYHIVVTVIDDTPDERSLVLVRRRKKFHASWNTVKLKQRLHDLLPLILEVCVCGAHEDLIPLVCGQQ
jgi:hypothetical protein